MQHRRLVYNTALLTLSSLLMSGIGMAFQVWLAARIGAAGLGLYQLTLSVANLGATFAISGIRFATTRLVAEELGRDKPSGIQAAMRRCLAYAAFFGVAALLILYFLAEPLACLAIRDARTIFSLQLAAFSMPCIALCSAMSGYFTACGRVWKPTAVHLLEQLSGVLLVAWALDRVGVGDIERSCSAVTFGRLAADLLSLLLMSLVYRIDRRHHFEAEPNAGRLTGRMLRLAIPLAVSAYARSALSTLQHLLVPRGLRASGFSADRALSGYGVLQGMVLPVLFFPSCLLGSLAELIVPELTEAQMRGDRPAIRHLVQRLLRASLGYSLLVSLFLFLCARPLAFYLYQSSQAGEFLRLLAPLVPVMYTDMTVDGCLKGLGEQLWSMGVNIAEALLGLLLVWQLLPRYALAGWIAILYITEGFNFILSAFRLDAILTGRRSSSGTAARRSPARPQRTA